MGLRLASEQLDRRPVQEARVSSPSVSIDGRRAVREVFGGSPHPHGAPLAGDALQRVLFQ